MDDISERSHRLLEEEKSKYSKILLSRLQARLGDVDGARKYAEILALVEHTFQSAGLVKEFHAYIQMVVGIVSFVRDPPFFVKIMYS